MSITSENFVLCLWKIFPLKLQEILAVRNACISLIRGHGVKNRNKITCLQRREIAVEMPGGHAMLFLDIWSLPLDLTVKYIKFRWIDQIPRALR